MGALVIGVLKLRYHDEGAQQHRGNHPSRPLQYLRPEYSQNTQLVPVHTEGS